MQKFDLVLPRGQWGGIKSKYPPDSQQVSMDDFSEGTFNVETDKEGIITKRKGGVEYAELATEPKDQYEAIFESGVHHLLTVQNGVMEYTSGDGVINSIINGTGFATTANFEFETILNRVYACNGINTPQVYDRSTSYGGVGYSAPRLKDMGCQVPTSGFTFNSFIAGGNVPDGSYTYKITYLYYGFEESNGAIETGTITVTSPNSTVRFDIPVGGYGVTARKIYRTVLGASNFILVGTVTNNTATSFDDDQAAGTFPIPALNALPPTFQNINLYLDRSFISGIAGAPYVLQFSDVGLPDIFPSRNFLRCNQEDPIVTHVVFKGRLIILNRQSLGQVLGRNRFQFRYDPIPDAVGCVDARSVQVRTVQGIPLLIWLSDKGFYAYNGNSVNYISEDIEDLVNFNIQQAQFTKGKNAQSSQQDFQNGTPGPGVDLTITPGSITSKNPKQIWDDILDWDGGETKTNIVTKAGDNKLKAPLSFNPVLSDGILSNDIEIDGLNLQLETISDFTGLDNFSQTTYDVYPFHTLITFDRAQRITIDRNGVITQVRAQIRGDQIGGASDNYSQLVVWGDSGGQPGFEVFTGSTRHIPILSGPQTIVEAVNINAIVGQKFWIGFKYITGGSNSDPIKTEDKTVFPGLHLVRGLAGWVTLDANTNNMPADLTMKVGYNFVLDNEIANGEWLSEIYDSLSDDISVTMSINNGSASYPASTSSITFIEGSDDITFATGVQVTEQFNNLNGTQVLSISGKRYWRIRVFLDSQNKLNTPIYGSPFIKFNPSATWISQAIDCTGDVSVYNALVIIDNTPSGTSLTYEVATSDDDISYTGWGPIGSAVVKRYLKLRIILTQNSTQTLTPDVSSVKFTWTIITQHESIIIDTGTNPAGWDIFQSSFTTNGAPTVFYLKSASTLGALPGASYIAVVPGAFPAVTPNQYAQWKVGYTVNEDVVPIINDVTVNWFLASIASIRAASLFFNKTYSLAVAEFGETHNNVLIELDSKGNWRIKRGVTINTFSKFFNEPYYGDTTTNKIVRFGEGTTDLGSDIELDLRTRDLMFNPETQIDDIKTKILKQVILSGTPTGATYQVYFSVDEGTTWILMTDQEGLSSYECPTDGPRWERRWIVNHQIGAVTSGRTLMIRIHNLDDKEVKIRKIRMKGFVRKNSDAYTETT